MKILSATTNGDGTTADVLLALHNCNMDCIPIDDLGNTVRNHHGAYDVILIWDESGFSPISLVRMVQSELPCKLAAPAEKIHRPCVVMLPPQHHDKAAECLEAGASATFRVPFATEHFAQRMLTTIYNDAPEGFVYRGFYTTNRRALYQHWELDLDNNEWHVLRTLMRNRDIMTHQNFFLSYFGWTRDDCRQIVASLRKKLKAVGAAKNLIYEVPKVGYMITQEIAQSKAPLINSVVPFTRRG